MSAPIRLPVQHPHAPHCPECKTALPTFDGAFVIMPTDSYGCKVLGTTLVFHVRCVCGARWDLKKES